MKKTFGELMRGINPDAIVYWVSPAVSLNRVSRLVGDVGFAGGNSLARLIVNGDLALIVVEPGLHENTPVVHRGSIGDDAVCKFIHDPDQNTYYVHILDFDCVTPRKGVAWIVARNPGVN